MNEHLAERLSAYVDGELEDEARTAAETHLTACAECRSAVQDLRRVVSLARALDDRPPAQDLWPAIAERIGAAPRADIVSLASRRRRFAFSVPQLAAAGVALSLLSAAAAGSAVHFLAPAAPVAVAAAPAALVRTVSDPSAPYDDAIRELEGLLSARRGDLDSTTVHTVEMSLHVIDLAITQARAAVERDPNNVYLNGHLQSTLDRKLDLLRRATMLPKAS
jgi:anti-sigma factor RsiW